MVFSKFFLFFSLITNELGKKTNQNIEFNYFLKNAILAIKSRKNAFFVTTSFGV
ncbi:Hypothetical protein MBVG_7150 [Mycoplasmopsis bovigenitalium 51080]|uniref:Uncharacterized protein n=1 Tax=Mycoplasmopsis bovigenitalium 51080 TaxID=1188235 RepID=N9VBJ7_9BACT|nr:Hypothetical protein MBVG_7150 [Mycoplasmopsis bovigenitalium 51080]